MRTTTRTAGTLAFAGAAGTLLAGCGGDAEAEAPDVAIAANYVDGTYDGARVENEKGGFQAQVTIENGVIASVAAIEAGTQDAQSVQINATAIPELAERVVEAQSADVDAVSGASFTSPGFLASIEDALEQATA
ncbi:FMN-binding protein [Demequina mangrovi]|uniref:FMN-binding domain-containing protein n=1 Tax=Demequina mangrovi TaxID=1043493 RepID=A0A1H6ZJD8_9MICO|nr:FMN-binding protein [Demequina mangrovi]SEJ49782.1 FMN-binding domain-containing protein [Demequina mangrovi]